MKSDPPARIGIPPGTRLIGLTRTIYAQKPGWQLWIAIKNPPDNPSAWVGTFLFCCDDGQVLRVQNDGDIEDVWEIKPADTCR